MLFFKFSQNKKKVVVTTIYFVLILIYENEFNLAKMKKFENSKTSSTK